ncbi:MAG TPA: hypothetical protein VLO30_01220, partial [Chthoniobacterales bacterium]|nr:hypothetical protein [Chthoniobacterales bacterium]
MDPKNFFAELKRRNVYKVAAAYAVVAWLLVQSASILFPTFEAPAWAMKVFVTAIAFGFPVALVLAWAFELTPEGIKRAENVAPNESITQRTGRKLDFLIIAVLLVVIAVLVYQRSQPRPSPTAASTPVPIPEKSIAVLPFENLSQDPDNAFFAGGVQDEILTDLARIADLKVISRSSVMNYKTGVERNLREIGKQLGVAHLLEGSVQRAANRIRINAQLIDARTDAHLWAQTYDRDLADVFAIQSEIARTIADQLQAKISPREKVAMSEVPTTDLEANKLYLQAMELTSGERVFEDPNAKQNMLRAVPLLDEAVARDPHFVLAFCRL